MFNIVRARHGLAWQCQVININTTGANKFREVGRFFSPL